MLKHTYTHFIKLLFIVVFILLYSGCSTLINIKDDLKTEKTLVTINGEVITLNTIDAPIIVVLLKDTSEFLKYIDYKIKKDSGSFTFITKPGKYVVYAWQDLNHNNKYDIDEPIGKTKVTKYLSGVDIDLKLTIKEASTTAYMKLLKDKNKQIIEIDKYHMHIGSVTSLDDGCFNDANISSGMVQPYTFLEKTPYGLFFLDEYHPEKKIILFVHGINGSPRNFKTIIDSIDKDKYQVLVYYYPSGLRLDIVSKALVEAMEELRIKRRYDKNISLIAHSMGGLVSRSYINKLKQKNDNYIDTFISISTPWDGHKSAETGLKYSPIVLSVWQDMAPHSDFLNQLFVTQLNPDTPYYLLFSYHGDNMIADENNDGVVSIKSQLKYIAQEQSTLVRGFSEDHMSILKNKQLIELVNRVLKK